MKSPVVVALTLIALSGGSTLVSAKGETSKLLITGSTLTHRLEIADPGILKDFNIWTGPGVVGEQDGFIAEWRAGSVATPPAELARYQVSFLVGEGPRAAVEYVAHYARTPFGQGYVYLPGPKDEHYALNTRSIYRGREGMWFRATKAWDKAMGHVLAPA